MRDVNHDLIAAGHPRLSFEFSAYLDNMPPHWDEKYKNAGDAGSRRFGGELRRAGVGDRPLDDNQGRARAAGATIARAAETVGAGGSSRAPRRGRFGAQQGERHRWPEFTEYGCFSCHHDLRDQAWRRRHEPTAVPAGSPRLGNLDLARHRGAVRLARRPPGEPSAQPRRSIGLAVLMEKPAAIPEIKAAVQNACEVNRQCLDDVAKHRFDVKTIEGLIDRIDDPKAWDKVASWDEAAQRYLALVPLYQSWLALAPMPTPKQDALRKRLGELLERLEFPKGFDSPRGFEPGRFRVQGR